MSDILPPGAAAGFSADALPITAFCNRAGRAVQMLYDFWRDRPPSDDDRSTWEAGRSEREKIIAELDRLRLVALATAGKSYPAPEAEKRLGYLFEAATTFLRRGVPRVFDLHWNTGDPLPSPVWELEAAGGYNRRERDRLADPGISERERAVIAADAEDRLHRARDHRKSVTQQWESLKRDVDWALKDVESLAAGCGEALPPPSTNANTEGSQHNQRKRTRRKKGSREKIIAALTLHHKYDNGSVGNHEPIRIRGPKGLVVLAGVSLGQASAFFGEAFKGHARYKAMCRDTGRLIHAMQLLNNEISPHVLNGRAAQIADDREED